MAVFLAICRGEDIDNSHLLALSTDRNLIKKVANLLAGTRLSIPTSIKQNKIRKMRRLKGLRQRDIEILTFGAIPQWRLSQIEQGFSLKENEAAQLSTILGISVDAFDVTLLKEAAAR